MKVGVNIAFESHFVAVLNSVYSVDRFLILLFL